MSVHTERRTVGSDWRCHVAIGNAWYRAEALGRGAVDIRSMGRAVLGRWRGWAVDLGLGNSGLLREEVGKLGRDTGEVVRRVLAG